MLLQSVNDSFFTQCCKRWLMNQQGIKIRGWRELVPTLREGSWKVGGLITVREALPFKNDWDDSIFY
jgi:hypothetical protein